MCNRLHLHKTKSTRGRDGDVERPGKIFMMKCLDKDREEKAYQHNALAEVLDRGSFEDAPPSLEGPVVVICGHALENKVVYAAGPQYGREASHRGPSAVAGDAIVRDGEGLCLKRELECRYALEQASLQRLELSHRFHGRRLPSIH